jgi:membrane-anchored glycerophosphoryl diester phosphodiesterase (GDPDase)
MREPLRPSTLGDILDRTAYLYRSRFLVFWGIAVVPTAVILVFALAAYLLFTWSGGVEASDFANGIMALLLISVGMFLVLPIFLGVSALSSAAMSHAVARINLGETTTIRDAYKSVWRRGWAYVGLYILEGLVIFGIPAAAWTALVFLGVGLSAFSLGAGLGAAGGALFGMALFLIFCAIAAYILYMVLRLSLVFPACVVEQIGAGAALKRSSTLTKGTKGRIFLLYLLGAVLGWILTLVVTIPFSILSALIPTASSPQHAQTLGAVMLFVIYGASFAIQSFTRPVYGIALVLFYYDQRIRQEAFDIEWMMLQAGLVAPIAVQPTPATTPETTEQAPQESRSNSQPNDQPISEPASSVLEEQK